MSLTNKSVTKDATGPPAPKQARPGTRLRASGKLLTRKLLPLFMSLAMIIGTLPMFTATAHAALVNVEAEYITPLMNYLDRLDDTHDYIAPFKYAYPNDTSTEYGTFINNSSYDAQFAYGSPDVGGFIVSGVEGLDWNKLAFHLFRDNKAKPNWDRGYYEDDIAFNAAIGKTLHGETANANLNALIGFLIPLTPNYWGEAPPSYLQNIIGIDKSVQDILNNILDELDDIDSNFGALGPALIAYLDQNGDRAGKYNARETLEAFYKITDPFVSSVDNVTSLNPVIAFGTGDNEVDLNKIAALFDRKPEFAVHLNDAQAVSDAIKEINKLIAKLENIPYPIEQGDGVNDFVPEGTYGNALEKIIGGKAFLDLAFNFAATQLPPEYKDTLAAIKGKIKAGQLTVDQWKGLLEVLDAVLGTGDLDVTKAVGLYDTVTGENLSGKLEGAVGHFETFAEKTDAKLRTYSEDIKAGKVTVGYALQEMKTIFKALGDTVNYVGGESLLGVFEPEDTAAVKKFFEEDLPESVKRNIMRQLAQWEVTDYDEGRYGSPGTWLYDYAVDSDKIIDIDKLLVAVDNFDGPFYQDIALKLTGKAELYFGSNSEAAGIISALAGFGVALLSDFDPEDLEPASIEQLLYTYIYDYANVSTSNLADGVNNRTNELLGLLVANSVVDAADIKAIAAEVIGELLSIHPTNATNIVELFVDGSGNAATGYNALTDLGDKVLAVAYKELVTKFGKIITLDKFNKLIAEYDSLYDNAKGISDYLHSNGNVEITKDGSAWVEEADGFVYNIKNNDKLSTNYDDLIYKVPVGSSNGYYDTLAKLGASFEYRLDFATPQPYSISANEIVADAGVYTDGTPATVSVYAVLEYTNAVKSYKWEAKLAQKDIVIVNPAPIVAETPEITGPQSASYLVDEPAEPLTVTVEDEDSLTLSYAWYYSETDPTDPDYDSDNDIFITNDSSYTPSTGTPGILYYYVVVTNTVGASTASVASDWATVAVTERSYLIELTDNDTEAILDNGEPGYVFADAVRDADGLYELPPALTVKVTSIGNTSTGALSISGDASFTISPDTIDSIEPEDEALFTVQPKDGLSVGTHTAIITLNSTETGATASFTVSFKVTDAPVLVDAETPSITAHPQNANYTQGATVPALSVTASVTDGGALSYQWYSNTGTGNTGGTLISGATSSIYTPPPSTAGTYYYYVEVTNTNPDVTGVPTATATSNVATVTVNSAQSYIPSSPGGSPAPVVETDIEEEETALADTPDARTPLAGFVTERIAYINGYDDGTVRPNGGLTRAEVSVMLYRLLDEAGKDNPVTASFADIADGKWYSQAVSYLAGKDILTGYSDGSFKPDAQITRAEFAAIISRFDESASADAAVRFSDVPASHWAFALIDNAAENGWLGGYPDGTFKPQNMITRAEAVTAINKMLNRELSEADIPSDVPVYTDLNASHWAYAALIEATYDWLKAADADTDADASDDADAEAEATEDSEAAAETPAE